MSAVVGESGAALSAGHRRWIFGAVEFDERSFELRVAGAPVELEPKPLEVLLHLLRHAGEIVTKEELMAAVWPGRILTDNSLPKSVSRIREVIGDDEQAVIKTVHGYGYRLVAPVTVQAAKAAPALTRLDLKAGDHPPLRPLWSLVEKLGGGGQGEVWLVRHDKTREPRVFKFALDVAGLAAIKREITLYRFLRETLEGRDEFTRVLDWNLEEAPYYIELEHGAGGNLEDWAESAGGLDKVPLATRLELVAQIAEALAAAHSVGVLHKDLKPSNVLVLCHPERSEGSLRIKLTDFGSGGVLDPARLEALGITRLGFTQSIMQGEAAATAMYLAPEVMSGQPATVQADVYALGILLYQMVAGDLRRPLAAGWERLVEDPLLCEDIAFAVAGEPTRRLADASTLATRLRTLEQRRRQHAAEQAEKRRLEQEQKAAEERVRRAELTVERLRTRRAWQRTVLAILIVAVSISLGLYLQARRARNEAATAAARSQAVADFLSKDMFAVVGEKPLRHLTVQGLLHSASASLGKRDMDLPEVAAQLHAALGNAFIAVEDFDAAEAHLDSALTRFERSKDAGSGADVTAAAQLLTIVAARRLWEIPAVLPRYETLLLHAQARLGPLDERVADLREQIATARFWGGDWRRGAEDMRQLVREQAARPDASQAVGLAQARLAEMEVQLGEFAAALAASRDGLARVTADTTAPRPTVALARCLLARVLIEQEAFNEAEAELSRAEELLRGWVAADNSMQILSVQLGRGFLRLRQGRSKEAVAILEPALGALTSLEWVRNNDAVAEFRSWLAQAYSAQGRDAKARQTMQKAVEVSVKQWGPRNPMSQGMRIAFADVVRVQDPASARKALDSVDQDVLAGLGEKHPYAAQWQRVLGLLALAEGRRADAERSLQEALRIFEARYGREHAFTRRARAELARAAKA